MYVVKIGEDQIRVIDKQDAKALMGKLLDMGCEERVTTKLVTDEDEEAAVGTSEE